MTQKRSNSRPADYSIRPTQDIYDDLQKIYDYFNWRLFEDKLPNCLITLQTRIKSGACFYAGRFHQQGSKHGDEIALNPAYFDACPSIDIFSALVCEMVHLWQYYFGAPGRGRYCNREWAEKMKSAGLHPSSTAQPGGCETGDSVSYYVIPNGPFDKAAREFITDGFRFSWQPTEKQTGPYKPRGKAGRRMKYSCPVCGLNAWARHGAKLVCGDDRAPMVPQSTK